jgi:hypothetical protein
MRRARWAVLLLYVAAVFLSLPYTPMLVHWSNARFGPGATQLPATVALALAGAFFALRLLRTRRPFPWPHLALAAIAVAAGASWRLLASSPIGRVHLPEYGLLAVLAGRAFGGTIPAALGGGAAAAVVGLLDETVQLFTPGRVFDWWDVALNVAAAVLGGLACAWWRWTRGTPP